MSCMVCQKTGRIFNVYTNYGNANHSVRDDLIEIFGVDVKQYLYPNDFVCNICMNMCDNLAKLKRKLWLIICCANKDCKPVKWGKTGDIIASLKIEEDDTEEEHTIPCRTPTPSNLLTLNYSREYNCRLEDQIANVERHRSLSQISSGRSNASVGHRTPRSRKVSSIFSEFDRSCSPLSDCSFISHYTMRKSPAKRKGVEYDEQGILVRKRTRSVSRAQEEEAKSLERLEASKFYCSEKDCPLYFKEVDRLSLHEIMAHNMLALHFCDECQQRYTTSEHLKLHKKTHDVYPFLCLFCACDLENQEALQQHLEEHAIYSVSCKYCDKSFLDKRTCESHCKSVHSGRRERIIYKDRIIIARVDKNLENGEDSTNNLNSRQYSYHFFPYTDMAYSSGDLDITAENFKVMNMDFIIDQDEPCSEPNPLIELITLEEQMNESFIDDIFESEVHK